MLRIRNDLIQGLKLLNIFIPHIKEMLIIICFQPEIKNLYSPKKYFLIGIKFHFYLPPIQKIKDNNHLFSTSFIFRDKIQSIFLMIRLIFSYY